MITGQIKNKIDALWNVFWSGGISNPLDVLEQITYLLFIRDLSKLDERRSKNSIVLGLPYESLFSGERANYRWDTFRQMAPQEMFSTLAEKIFPFIKTLHGDKNSAFSRYIADAIFKIPTPEKLVAIIDGLEEVFTVEAGIDEKDIRGDIYEYMLGKLATSGTLGQFRTPRHIIQMIVEMVKPGLQDTICDPACGTTGFLVQAGQYIRQKHSQDLYKRENLEHFNQKMFTGFDIDHTMLRIGAMNLITHGVENPHVEYKDSLSELNEDKDCYSIVLANPPFKGSITKATIAPDLLKVTNTTKTELLFLALFLRILRTGGKAAVIVPDGVLFGSSNAHKSIRKEIVENHRLEAVISMPSGVFKPYAGVSTAILFFTKTGHGGTDNVWFYDMQADGYSLDDKRQEVEENDIPDILARWSNLADEMKRVRSEKSFMVSKAEIVGKDYDLSINKYKEVVYEKEDLPPPHQLLSEIDRLNAEFERELKALMAMLEEK